MFFKPLHFRLVVTLGNMPPKKPGTKSASKSKQSEVPAEGAHIVFEDDNTKKKNKKSSKPKDATAAAPEPGPPKPTVKQLIGGSSWTGKVPVQLFSEHCQRQKWDKPDYSMRQIPGRDGHENLYRSEVTLSAKDPKTQEKRTVKFRTPEALITVSEESSALEARHFAACYALYRVSSMKNLSMALPPKYRDLWKTFAVLKKEDEADDKGWLYDADPFAAQKKGEDIAKSIEKRKVDSQKKAEAAKKDPVLALQAMPRSRDRAEWERAPQIEMGAKIRAEIERIVREDAVWNPIGVRCPQNTQQTILKALIGQGFRAAHVKEALQYCQDEEEVLEWLLIHVPDDDLPTWSIAQNYTAGISIASGDVGLEAKLKRLAVAGYPKDFVAQALKFCNGDEHKAGFWLQESLEQSTEGDLNDDIDSKVEWEGEEATLEAIYGERYTKNGERDCTIELEVHNLSVRARFLISKTGYPFDLPVILVSLTKIPAYIRLSATKQALQFAQTNFKGGPMVFNICEWLEQSLDSIIDSPMSLTELHMSEKRIGPGKGEILEKNTMNMPSRPKRSAQDSRDAKIIRDIWTKRQSQSDQQQMLKARQKLPAFGKQNGILQTIASHRATIVTGETGSGKSTQVVQFVLDEAISALKGSKTNIMCTQPRRVAALSLAERVSDERCSRVGDEVGYIIRGESKVSSSTKITFMTTGVLLRRIQMSSNVGKAFEGISHVFVDEVHERSLDTDFLLALLKDALQVIPTLSVVLMSATLDKDIFMSYFGGAEQVGHVHIEGRTFPVADYHLEDVLARTQFVPEHADAGQGIGKIIASLGTRINFELITSLVLYIDHELGDDMGGILIFLPGTMEIERCVRALSASSSQFLAYPLHASLTPAEQKRVFQHAPKGRRKIVCATNVAETSITIDDVVAVIDTGKVKATTYDATNNIVRLEEVWASQAACKQRRGRAGRVQSGVCYKLFTAKTEESMAPKPLPEIQRVPLEQLCLSVKASDQSRDVPEFLQALITPPESGAISNALNTLSSMGALERGQLTALGNYMSSIPADLRCAKLLVFGTLFDCLEPCLTIASILTVKDPFVSPRDRREEADSAKMSYSTSHGDLMLSLNAYEDYTKASQDLRQRQLQNWCNERFLSLNTLRDITSTRSQLVDSLKDANLLPFDYRSDKTGPNQASALLLRALISASLQPQIASIHFPDRKYIQSLTGAKELDAEAKTIKYFIPPSTSNQSSNTTPTTSRPGTPQPRTESPQWQRVFISPSSPLFHSTPASFTSNASSANYLSYFSKMATGAQNTLFGPKTYIHSLTPLNTYTQLLFGSGGIKIDTEIPGGGMVVGEHFKVRGWARIGVLVSRLRRLLDEELRRAIDLPAERREFGKSDVVRVVKWLIELNGQDR